MNGNSQKFSFVFYVIALVAALCALPFLSSDPKYNIDSMAFCQSLAAEHSTGGYTVTAQARTHSDEHKLYTGSGKTLEAAVENLTGSCEYNLFFGSCELIYLDRTMESRACRDELSKLVANHEAFPFHCLAVFCDEKASEALTRGESKELKLRLSSSGLSKSARLYLLFEKTATGEEYLPVTVSFKEGYILCRLSEKGV